MTVVTIRLPPLLLLAFVSCAVQANAQESAAEKDRANTDTTLETVVWETARLLYRESEASKDPDPNVNVAFQPDIDEPGTLVMSIIAWKEFPDEEHDPKRLRVGWIQETCTNQHFTPVLLSGGKVRTIIRSGLRKLELVFDQTVSQGACAEMWDPVLRCGIRMCRSWIESCPEEPS